MALKAVLERMTAADRWIVLILLALDALSFAWVSTAAQGGRVLVEFQGQVVFSAPLDHNRQDAISGPLGETTLAIRDGKVCVLQSPCAHKVCMGMGEISRAGELLACVPNQLVVRIEGTQPRGGYDLLSR